MESVYADYKPMSDLIIGQIDDDMLIGEHVAISSDEIITHVDVLSVVELHYRNLKESLTVNENLIKLGRAFIFTSILHSFFI